MKKILVTLLMCALLLPSLSACRKAENNGLDWRFHVAQELDDQGWLYTFEYIEYEDEEDFADSDKYSFYRINVRYLEKFQAAETEAYASDSRIIYDSIIHEGMRPEDILALDPDDFTFECLDKEMVFRLIREGLTNEAEPDITDRIHLERYDRGFFTEVKPSDGYEFQVAYVSGSAGVDALFIDVLYYADDGTYAQLSDMVTDGSATDAQKQAFEEFGKIIETCQKKDSYIIDDTYRDMKIGGIDFGRLYTFLYNLHTCNWDAIEQHIPTPVRLN